MKMTRSEAYLKELEGMLQTISAQRSDIADRRKELAEFKNLKHPNSQQYLLKELLQPFLTHIDEPARVMMIVNHLMIDQCRLNLYTKTTWLDK
jgi:hypothetical protein